MNDAKRQLFIYIFFKVKWNNRCCFFCAALMVNFVPQRYSVNEGEGTTLTAVLSSPADREVTVLATSTAGSADGKVLSSVSQYHAMNTIFSRCCVYSIWLHHSVDDPYLLQWSDHCLGSGDDHPGWCPRGNWAIHSGFEQSYQRPCDWFWWHRYRVHQRWRW